jgi:NAD-dependent SIR2 family protein deacetylase
MEVDLMQRLTRLSDDTRSGQNLAEFVDGHKRLFVLTGAGCSTESGIPDYRNAEGQWKRTKPVQLHQFLHSDSVRKQYWARSLSGWQSFAQAKPNLAHWALASLETSGYVYQLVTQNVDGLHQRAGSRRVIDLHGRLDMIQCIHCSRRQSRERFQEILKLLNSDFRDLYGAMAPDGDADLEDIDFSAFRIPGCQHCGGILKPGVVFFGESVPRPRVQLALRRLKESDAVLVVGSSLMVYSGYRFCRAAVEAGMPIAAINLGRTRADNELTLKVTEPCGKALSELTKNLPHTNRRSPPAPSSRSWQL